MYMYQMHNPLRLHPAGENILLCLGFEPTVWPRSRNALSHWPRCASGQVAEAYDPTSRLVVRKRKKSVSIRELRQQLRCVSHSLRLSFFRVFTPRLPLNIIFIELFHR